jgi:hypothetical protein
VTAYRSDLTPSDRRFVIATWSSTYKSAHAAGLITDEDWPVIAHAQFGKVIDRPMTRTIVAYEPDGFLTGWICGVASGAVPIVHYVFVKAGYRTVWLPGDRWSGPRHARALFRALGVDPDQPYLYSCKTPIVSALERAGKIPRGARFCPQAGRYANYNHR